MLESSKNAVTVIYSGGDIQVPFLFYDAADLVVLFETTVKIIGTDYTVSGAGSESGGKITLVKPPANGTRVTVIRKIEFTQLLQIPANGILPEGALNRTLDRIVMMIQQLEERADRAVEYPEGTESDEVANAAELLDSIENARTDINSTVLVVEETLAASTAATNAANKALTDAEAKRVQVNSDGDAQVQRVLDEGNTQHARVVGDGNTQHSRVVNEGDAQHARVVDEGNAQHSRVVSEGNAQYIRVQNMGNTKASDITTKHQTAVNEITSKHSSALGEVDAHKVEAKAQIDATKEQTINTIAEMPNYSIDHETILKEKVNNLITGAIAGTEGRWKLKHSGSFVPSSLVAAQHAGGTSTVVWDSSFPIAIEYGNRDYIDTTTYSVVVGDSGKAYVAFVGQVGSAGQIRAVFLHPKYGDVCSDFTVGRTYHAQIFQESTAPADQQTGDLDVVEYFIGNSGAGRFSVFDRTKAVSHPSKPADNVSGYIGTDFEWDTAAPDTGFQTSHGFIYYFGMGFENQNTRLAGGTLDIELGIRSAIVTGFTLAYKKVDGSEAAVIETLQSPWNNDTGVGKISIDLPQDIKYPLSLSVSSSTSGSSFNYMKLHISDGKPLVDSILGGANTYATLNVGYWKGKDWQSQLLSDSIHSGAIVGLKLDRKKSGETQLVEILDSKGQWKQSPRAYWPPAGMNHTEDDSQNKIFLDTAQTYATLGYASKEEMLLNSAVRVTYKTKARVLRPMVWPRGIFTRLDRVYLLSTASIYSGVKMLEDMVGSVATVSGSQNINWAACTIGADIFRNSPTRRSLIGHLNYEPTPPRYPEPNSCACLAVLYEDNSKLFIGFYFKELILDGDWGDSSRFLIVSDQNGIMTTTDDNGNVALTGCVSFDTGIPA